MCTEIFKKGKMIYCISLYITNIEPALKIKPLFKKLNTQNSALENQPHGAHCRRELTTHQTTLYTETTEQSRLVPSSAESSRTFTTASDPLVVNCLLQSQQLINTRCVPSRLLYILSFWSWCIGAFAILFVNAYYETQWSEFPIIRVSFKPIN